MNTELAYEAAIDRKCYEIRLAQKALAYANVPDALSYSYGDGEWGKEQVKSELLDLVAIWDEGAVTLRTIADELEALNKSCVLFDPFLFIERVDVAIDTATETKVKIEAVAEQVAELKVDHLHEWADDAQELIGRLAFPVSPMRLYDWRGMPRWYGLEALYPFDEIPREPSSIAQVSWNALTPNPLTGMSGLLFKLTRRLFAKYIRPNQAKLVTAFHYVLLLVAILVFPYHAGYSFGAIALSIVAECYRTGYWDDFLLAIIFYGALYACLLAWFG